MRPIPMILFALVLCGCGRAAKVPQSEFPEEAGRGVAASMMVADESVVRGGAQETGQKIIRNAQLSVEVEDLDRADRAVRDAVQEMGGRVESATRFKDERIHLRVRIRAAGLDTALERAAGLGRVISRTVSENDVTTRYIDTEARLNTRLALRTRLQKLLESAESVEDLLNIERELARVQGEIDSMQGQLDYLDRQVDESTLDLTLQTPEVTPPEQKPGPLGYVFVGIWKAVKWLFVWEK